MTDIEASLREFHVAFDCVRNDKPTVPDKETKALRLRLLEEEYNELVEAIENDDLVGILQESVDLVYVAVGINISYGLPFNAGFDEVHRANMRKLVDGKVITDPEGKVQKPKGWMGPELQALISTEPYWHKIDQ